MSNNATNDRRIPSETARPNELQQHVRDLCDLVNVLKFNVRPGSKMRAFIDDMVKQASEAAK